jgi:alpha-beta hydrolase superfamily lysophospholipase
MPDNIMRDEVAFPSSDGKTQIQGFTWNDLSIESPRGIVQIAHGMAEHIERYDSFARFLASQGFIVAGHDHLGHGKSVSDTSQWGCLPTHTGARILVEDVHRMRSLVTARFSSDLPYFLFGHSMGSFITRSYITKHPQGLAGAILCGTGHVPPATSHAGNLAARAMSKVRGENFKSKMLDTMGIGAYNKPIDTPRTNLDWLSFDEENVDRYIADGNCGFMFAAGGYATITTLTGEVCTPASAAAIPHDLPLLFISGDGDPVGSMGAGVQTTAAMAREAGVKDVEVKLYEHMRHEILNETNNQDVFDDVLAWIERHC